MRIRCPSCSATYEVADALLDPPRTVRCARCAHDWMASPVAEDESSAPKPASEAAPASGAAAEVPFHEAAPPPPAAHPESARAASDVEAQPADLSAIERLATAAEPSPIRRRPNRLLLAAWAASFLILAGFGATAFVKRDALMRLWPASTRVYATIGLVPAAGPGHGAPAPEAAKPAH